MTGNDPTFACRLFLTNCYPTRQVSTGPTTFIPNWVEDWTRRWSGHPGSTTLLFVAIGVFWILLGLYYLIGGLSGLLEFDMFGFRVENAYVLLVVFELLLGIAWLFVVTRHYDGKVSFRS